MNIIKVFTIIIIILVISASLSFAQSRFQANFNFSLGFPQAEFKENVDNIGLGATGSFVYNLPDMPFLVGASIGFLVYGRESREEPFSQTIQDVRVDVTTWNNILMTPRRTYIFDPDYGSDLHKIIFDPVDDSTVERIKTEVETRIRNYDDRATIEEIEVLLNSNGKGYTVNLFVEYEGETGTLSVKFDDSTVVRQQGGAI